MNSNLTVILRCMKWFFFISAALNAPPAIVYTFCAVCCWLAVLQLPRA